MRIVFNSVILCSVFLSVTFIAYGPEVGINKPWGQTFDSARKHYSSFRKFLSKMVLILHLYHMKNLFYNLFIKLVTGFWGHE